MQMSVQQLHQVSQIADSLVANYLAEAGLTVRQFVVLDCVGANSGISNVGIVAETRIDRGTVSDIVERLSKRQLLARERTKYDTPDVFDASHHLGRDGPSGRPARLRGCRRTTPECALRGGPAGIYPITRGHRERVRADQQRTSRRTGPFREIGIPMTYGERLAVGAQPHPAIWLVPATLLLIATFALPEGYDTFLRIVVFAAGAYLTYFEFRLSNGNIVWAVVFGGLTILFNPIAPIALAREIWFYLNIAAACFLFVHWLIVKQELTPSSHASFGRMD